MKRNLAILGSTGSIGTQTLDIVRRYPDYFVAHTLTAGNNADLLIAQALEFVPDSVVIANEDKYEQVAEALSHLPIKVYAGAAALNDVVGNEHIHMVVSALVGFAGLAPTMQAIKAQKPIALANKETLVVAGHLMTQLAAENHIPLLPVDSEHSAIFQSLVGETQSKIEKILLTASGGPFRKMDAAALRGVTAAQALKHPNWEMGAKITIDSSTLMNKGFEMIEAKWLFNVAPKDIEVVVHPESIVHSAVQFDDGSIKAQLGVPDMHLPIQYALSYPFRLPIEGERVDLMKLGQLHFEAPDMVRFPCLGLAFDAIKKGGNLPCAMNAANEVANLSFRQGDISFPQIVEIIGETMVRTDYLAHPQLDEIFDTDAAARRVAQSLI